MLALIDENRQSTIVAAVLVFALFVAGLHCLGSRYGRPFLVATWLRLLELLPPYW